jgi:zinc protease
VLYKKTDYKNDEIMFGAQSWGGRSLSPEADHFTTMVATEVIDNGGLATFSMNDLMKVLSGKNVSISPSVSMEQDLINGSSTPKDLRTFFELLHLGFVQPRKDAEAFAAWKTSMKANLANKEKSPEAAFFDTIMVAASNNHPRARSMSEADVDKVDLDKAYDFFRQRFSAASDFTFYFVGNFDEEMLKKYCETYIASLPSAPTKEQWKDVGIRSRKGQYRKTVYKGVESKSFVVLSESGPMTYGPRERYDVIALCEVMEIQLREQLREEKGGVYFVNVQPNFTRIPTQEFSVNIIFSCAPERANELISVVKSEMAALRAAPVPDSLVAKVREMQIKERETGMKTNRFWMSVLSQFERDGEDYSNLALRDELIAKLTPAQVLSAAKKYLVGTNFAEFVLKPESERGKDPADTPAPSTKSAAPKPAKKK